MKHVSHNAARIAHEKTMTTTTTTAANALHDAIMNLPCERTMSHFATKNEYYAHMDGHRDARHAAAELVAVSAATVPAKAVLPDGWVSLSIVWDGDTDYPEEVAYGPKHMMDRLGKKLEKYLAIQIAAKSAEAAPVEPVQAPTIMECPTCNRTSSIVPLNKACPFCLPAQAQPVAYNESFTLDQIADACIEAEISDGQFESLSISLLHSAPQPVEVPQQQQDQPDRISAVPAEPAGQLDAEVSMIGKLLDDFSELQHLWGLGEPGALVRHRDVFNMLIAAGKEEQTRLAGAAKGGNTKSSSAILATNSAPDGGEVA